MALVNCRECGKAVSDTAKICPSCGIKSPVPKTPKKKMPDSTKKLLLGGFIVALGFTLFNGVSKPQRSIDSSIVKTESTGNCNIPMKNGVMSDRACDLVELCKDLHFTNRRATQFYLDGKIADQRKAEGEAVKILGWLAAYDSNDVMRVCEPDKYAKLEAQDRQIAASKLNVDNGISENENHKNPNPLLVFVVGSNLSKSALTDLLNQNFPGSVIDGDGSILVVSEGVKYKIKTKLNVKDEQREILSIGKI